MNWLIYRRQKGFALVELLVYIAILIIVTIVVVLGIVQISRAFARAKVDQKISLAAETALSRIVHEIRSASDVTARGAVLTINAPTTHIIDVNAGSPQVMLLDTANLTPIDVTVPAGGLIFTEITGAGESRAVRVALTLQSSWGDYSASYTYYATGVLRGSY